MYQEQFPVQVLEYSDIAKVFHPTALALSSNEDNWVYKAIFANFSQNGKYKPSFLMADGSKAITIACNEVWPMQNAVCALPMSIETSTRKFVHTQKASRKEFSKICIIFNYQEARLSLSKVIQKNTLSFIITLS